MLRMISLLGCLMLTICLGAPSAWAVNRALSLDGDGDYVSMQDSESLRLSTNQTIEFEVNPRKYHHDWVRVVGKGAGDNRNYGVWLSINLEILYQFGIDGQHFNFHSNAHLSRGNLYHIACTYDGNVVKIYVNGNLDSEGECTVTPNMTDDPLTIGYAGYHTYLGGFVDEVRIWNVARTQEEIQDNMNQPIENPASLPNLVGYWNFDSGTADDLSQYENHGDLYGGAHIADVIYVSPEGSDITGDGTFENPYGTIQKGIDESRRNDIVQVLPGTYEENIRLYSDLIVLGSGAENTTIAAESENVVTANNIHNISLSGFTLDGGGNTADYGIAITGNSTVSIFNNHIVGAKTGVWCADSSSPLIENNTIAENVENGIYCQSTTTATIQYNLIRDNNLSGVMCENASPTIHENTITGNSWGIMAGESTPTITQNHINKNGQGVWLRGNCAGKLYHNTIELNRAEGIVCGETTKTEIVGNAISYNNAGFYCNNESNPLISENLIHSNRGVALYATHSSVPKMIRNIIRNNGGGIAFDMSAHPTIGGSPINANTIVDNGGWGISHSTDNIINATYNYWGTTDETEIASMMRGEGKTIFKPFINTLDEIIADVSGDGTISALDAALILQYVIGLIDKFPATSPIGQAAQKYVAGEITIDELDRLLQKWGYPSVFKLLGLENQLLQNYPNPFNPDTWIPFKLAQSAPVTINIYDTKGQLVRTLHIGNKGAGIYVTKDKAAYWDGMDSLGENVGSGIYFYTLQAGDFRATRKMLIVK